MKQYGMVFIVGNDVILRPMLISSHTDNPLPLFSAEYYISVSTCRYSNGEMFLNNYHTYPFIPHSLRDIYGSTSIFFSLI